MGRMAFEGQEFKTRASHPTLFPPEPSGDADKENGGSVPTLTSLRVRFCCGSPKGSLQKWRSEWRAPLFCPL